MNVPNATDRAIAMFKYREEVVRKPIPHDPDWGSVMRNSFGPALAGERGATEQEQCVIQAIQLALWESGVIRAPWAKAFLPAPLPLPWYRRWWNKVRAFLHDLF